jgi:hypothetical protein
MDNHSEERRMYDCSVMVLLMTYIPLKNRNRNELALELFPSVKDTGELNKLPLIHITHLM